MAGASADGGIVVIEEINSGGNQGNTIGVGDLCAGAGGTVSIDGGTVDNSTNIDIDASGGTAIADASGGDGNLAAATGDDDRDNGGNGRGRGPIRSRYGLGGRGGLAGRMASAGNGGRANASADGGIVVIGKINSGGNRGNTINVGDIGGGAYGECSAGPVYIDGGDVNNSTNIDIDASGGTAIGDASGGSGNLAAATGNDDGGGRGRGGPIHSRYGLGARGNGGGSVATWRQPATVESPELLPTVASSSSTRSTRVATRGTRSRSAISALPRLRRSTCRTSPRSPANRRNLARPSSVPTGRPGRGGSGGKVRVTRVPSTGVGYIPTSPAPVTTILIAVLPARREDEDGVHQEDDRIR